MITKGSNVGNWLVTSEKFKEDGIYWNECECICGTKRKVRTWHLNNSKTKGCGCTNIKGRFRYKGIGELSKAYYNSFKKSRMKNGKTFDKDLTIGYLWELFLKQDKKCAISGLPIVLVPNWSSYNKGSKKVEQTASIDRIDSNKGYSKDNIQWVHKKVNFMKGNLSEDEFISMCNIISTYMNNIA